MWFLALWLGCGAEAVDCASRAVEECSLEEGCMVLDARPLEPDGEGGWCEDYNDPAVDVACVEIQDCGQAETLATSRADQCWVFNETCTPEGWTDCTWEVTSYTDCAD